MTTETKSEPKILVRRYSGSARVNHWIVATCFVLLLLSGLSLFHPSLYSIGATLFGEWAERPLAPSVDWCRSDCGLLRVVLPLLSGELARRQ